MPGVQGLTREQIRVAIGREMRAIQLVTAATTGSATTFLTDDLFGGGAENQSRWLLGTGPSNNDGTLARIVTAAVTANRTTLTTFPAWTSTATSDTAEIWEQRYNPRDIEALVNIVIGRLNSTEPRFFDPVEDITFHGGYNGSLTRIDIPTTFDMISDVLYRSEYDFRQVLGRGTVWDESVDSDFTVTRDSKDLLFGYGATKFVIASAVSAGDIASDSISSVDLSGFTHIEFPIKSTIATSSGNLIIRLSATANGASTTEEITVPALTARAETWVRVAMTAPELSTAIISVALEADGGNIVTSGGTVWIGRIEATRNDNAVWTPVRRDKWVVDLEARDLNFVSPGGGKSTGAEDAGYSLLKLVGGDNPVTLDADATVSEIPEDYIINQVVAEALLAFGDEKDSQRASVFAGYAAAARASFPSNTYYRLVA